ncbi:tetratricopeptide repeat protein [Caballeronia udeis]|nr:tetratricopeptide repeat protein [Caballeronia udeis]
MLNFARSENLAGAMQAASAIDALAKPARGDRANARKLNQTGLGALNESKTDDAVHLLEQANRLDPGDEEIISNLAYAYAMNGQLAQSEDTAVLALALNPRRTSIWAPLAVTLQKEKRPDQAIEAMWLAYQFSADKQKTLAFIDSHVTSERDPDVKSLYERSKAWFVANQKPSFNTQG